MNNNYNNISVWDSTKLIGIYINNIIKDNIEYFSNPNGTIEDIKSFNNKYGLTKITYTPDYFPDTSSFTPYVREYYDKILENFKKLQNDKIQINDLNNKLFLKSLKVGCIIREPQSTMFNYIGSYHIKNLISINFEGIENFTKLKKLHLKNVYITPDNYEQLSKSNIEEIIIETSFSDDDFKFLSNIKTLKSITFDTIQFKNIDNCADIFKLPLEEFIINMSSINNKSAELTNNNICGELFFSSLNNCKTLKNAFLNSIIKYSNSTDKGILYNNIYNVNKYMTNIPFTIIGKDDLEHFYYSRYIYKKDLNKPFILMNSFYCYLYN